MTESADYIQAVLFRLLASTLKPFLVKLLDSVQTRQQHHRTQCRRGPRISTVRRRTVSTLRKWPPSSPSFSNNHRTSSLATDHLLPQLPSSFSFCLSESEHMKRFISLLLVTSLAAYQGSACNH